MKSSIASLLVVFAPAVLAPALAFGQEPKQHAPDDSNVPEPKTDPAKPVVGGHEAGGADRSLLHIPWHLDPSPEWTQDRGWPGTRFWRLDQGSVEVETWWQAKVHPREAAGPQGRGVEHLLQYEVEVGLLPGVQLDVYENIIKEPGTDFQQEGNQIEFRIAPWAYGTVPLNPTLYLEWHPVHNGRTGDATADKYEIRLLVGGSPIEHLFLAANTITECETGGDRYIEWGFTAAAAYELVPGVLRVGMETRVTWEFQQHHESPTDGFDGEVGPNVFLRPLAALDPAWGHWLKISWTCFLGLNHDRASERVRSIMVAGCEF